MSSTANPSARTLELVLVDFDDTLVTTAPRFAGARRQLFDLLAGAGFDHAVIDRVHHQEVDPVMRERHGFGPQRMGVAFEETYRALCHRVDRPVNPELLRECGRLGGVVAGTPPVIEGAMAALRRLAESLPTVVYTQAGDPDYQLECLREAGAVAAVGEARVRIVAVKTADTLRATLGHYGVRDPGRACMIGNSVRSDVNPALELGVPAILVEVDEPWHHDVVDPLHDGFTRVRRFTEAVDLLLGDDRGGAR